MTDLGPPHAPAGLSRRHFLEGAAALSASLILPARSAFSEDGKFQISSEARQAMAKSPLVYLSPLQSSGKESKCHAEIWFAHHGDSVYVVTPASAWRTRAIQQGLDRARVWVGDHGVWSRGSEFKSAPSYVAKASIVTKGDDAVERCLATMGKKYSGDWKRWGPRFRNGLKDGSRVMLRYEPVGA